MTDMESFHLDYEASAAELSKWLAGMRDHTWNPTAEARELRGLAKKLGAIADHMDGIKWTYLEDEVDRDPPKRIGLDGFPIEPSGTNAGRYRGSILGLREIAEVATRMAMELPNPRSKQELQLAADYFLRLWLEAGNEKPSIYDKSPAVFAFKAILDSGGYVLSNERVRGILGQALEKFDPHYYPPGYDIGRFLVWRQ